MNLVAVVRTEKPLYPENPPYHPAASYPEYPFPGHYSPEPNYVYQGVRDLLNLLGLDQSHKGTKDWNPLGFLIEPGMTVVLKPNFVLSSHMDGKNPYSIITHPAILRAVADYCWIALKGEGNIIIADAPQYDCNFQELVGLTKLDQVIDFYHLFKGPKGTLQDLRNYWSRKKHFPSMCEALPGDTQGGLTVNLGEKSALWGQPNPEKYYGAVYHRQETIAHHNNGIHKYTLSRTIMNADVIISVPKLKVHKKVGVTLNAKGLVGVVTNKNCLVHYSLTPPSKGGDQYPESLFTPMEQTLIRLERWMYDHLLAPRKRLLEDIHRSIYWLHGHSLEHLGFKVSKAKRMFDAGNWYGNDSAWRMTVDLMRAVYFSSREGRMCSTPQRRIFSFVDGVIGGENNGPLAPNPVSSGVLLAGENLLAVDLVATRLMGFDPLKIRMYQSMIQDRYFDFGVSSLKDIKVICDNSAWADCLKDKSSPFLNFKPHPGWVGHLEI